MHNASCVTVFVCLFCMRYFVRLSLRLGVMGWLRFVIVALPGLFTYIFGLIHVLSVVFSL